MVGITNRVSKVSTITSPIMATPMEIRFQFWRRIRRQVEAQQEPLIEISSEVVHQNWSEPGFGGNVTRYKMVISNQKHFIKIE